MTHPLTNVKGGLERVQGFRIFAALPKDSDPFPACMWWLFWHLGAPGAHVAYIQTKHCYT